jgi:PAS domain S-box-containing protein
MMTHGLFLYARVELSYAFLRMTMEIQYSPSLILLSIAVAIFASYVALNFAQTVSKAKGKAQIFWLAGGALAMGIGIWSMHFVGMLAFEMPGMEMAYDIPLMLLSVVVAIFGSALALYVVSRPIVHTRSVIIGGIAMAIAISGMHYIGMYSMRMAARIEWNCLYVFLSVLIALGASFAALMICIRLRYKPNQWFQLFGASIVMGAAISGMHYMGMIAATFVHDHSLHIDDSNLLVTSGLSFATISTTLLILGLALGGSFGKRILDAYQERSDNILESSEGKFRVLVEAVKDYAIFIIDTNGYITTWNTGAQRITGYLENEIVGKHFSILYGKEDRMSAETANELSMAIKSGHFETEAKRYRKDGSFFWANIVLDPLVNKSGALTGFSKVIRDITGLKNAEERNRSLNEELERRVLDRTHALQERERQLRTIANAMPVLVAQIDSHQHILFANDSFCDWFNFSADQIIGRTIREVLGEDRYPANSVYIEKALKGETVTYERQSYSRDRSAILNITFVPEFNDEHQVKGFIIVAANVSSYKTIEAELKDAKIAADVANETKSAFLANMSHEIRTPLGAVIGFSELLVDGNLSVSEKRNTIEVIKRNGRLLSTIINDILDLSKVEAGKMEIERIPVSLFDLVREIAVLLNLDAVGKGIQLNVSFDGPIPKTVLTDPSRLRQILFNIVGNAIKFTDRGTVSLTIKLDPDDKDKILFIVQDTGTGITEEQQQRLFSPFMQADVTTTRRFGGTGLGLVLSKKLSKALNGDVRLAHSALGKGSTFVISIAHGQPEMAFIENTNQNQAASSQTLELPFLPQVQGISKLKILIVDDSLDNLALIKHILKIAGATVETANNGKEGIEKALGEYFDVILMDLQMPVMDGYEATKALRKSGFTRPIIALTAHAMKEERIRCLANGFDDHLTKPIDRNALMKALSGVPILRE